MQFNTYHAHVKSVQALKLTERSFETIQKFVIGDKIDDLNMRTGKGEIIKMGDYVVHNGIGYSIVDGKTFEDRFGLGR